MNILISLLAGVWNRIYHFCWFLNLALMSLINPTKATFTNYKHTLQEIAKANKIIKERAKHNPKTKGDGNE